VAVRIREGRLPAPDPETAIQVTAKWTCEPGDASLIEELRYWWQRVGTDAHSLEEGLLRYEVYQAFGEEALIIHETFENSAELKFHLSKGTAEKYKKDVDKIAAPEAYFFRGPVAWTIGTYSSQGSNFTRPGGSLSDGTTG
jgi:quinol monooxygenase YgiN